MQLIKKSSSLKFFAFVILTATLVSGCRNLTGTTSEINPQNPAPNVQSPIVLAEGMRASYADVVERVAPAVVNISARRRSENASAQQPPRANNQFDLPDLLEQMPQQQRRPSITRGAGSGVIVSADGLILTNNHVVEGATDIEIELTDRRTFKAKVVGTDAPTDLAVLKVEAGNLPFMNLGDSDKVRIGDVVMAVGNPLGIGQTVTLGIISAKGRRTGKTAEQSGDGFEDFLQTDAPINRGNSGGALVNLTGELIGINSQILSPIESGGGSIGIGFAIPSNMSRNVMDQLVKNGKVRRGLLGVNIQELTSEDAAALDLKDTRGAIVAGVQPNSAAEKAGLKRYDIITALNGERIVDGNSFRNRVASMQPGSEITITISRDGKEQEIKAVLDERTVETAEAETGQNQPKTEAPSEASSGKLGLGLQPLTPEAASKLRIQAEKGLVVTEVDESGPAAEKGIQNGDVILEINRQPVGTFEEVEAALTRAGERPVGLLVARRGNTVFMTIQPRK